MIRFILIIPLLIFINSASAELHIDISEPTLEVSTGFTGDTLTLFGTSRPKGDIVILIKGPKSETIIRRKKDIFGLWIKAESVQFSNVHGYYNVASSRAMADIATPEIRREYNMGINSLRFETIKDIKDSKKNRFQEALIQNMQLNGLYALTPNAVEYINDTLFKTRIRMPANVPLGDYKIEAFLFKDGQLIDSATHPFYIKQVGMAADVHDFANDKPFWYGISVILIALFSSFLAIILLRRE